LGICIGSGKNELGINKDVIINKKKDMSVHNSNRVKWMTQVAADFFQGSKDYEALVSIF